MSNCIVKRGSKKSSIYPTMQTVKFGEDGDFYTIPSNHEQTFRIAFDDDMVRGMYQDESERSIVYLRNHSNIEDIISTCNHEALHHAISYISRGGFEGRDEIDIDTYMHHWAIRQVEWIMNDCLSDEHIESKNDVLRDKEYYS